MRAIYLLIAVLSIACSGEVDEIGEMIDEAQADNEIPEAPEEVEEADSLNADYWGCWTEHTGDPYVYDISLTEIEQGSHRLDLGKDCDALPVASIEAGYFRNDTLIIDNGHNVYWCFVQSDTLYYSAYLENYQADKHTFVRK